MGLLDHEARAMAVKMLSEEELKTVHVQEEKLGRYMIPSEVASFSKLSRRDGVDIGKWWRIPDNVMAQAAHADRVKVIINDLMRRKQCHVSLGEDESRVNFDWHVFHADIDLSYQPGKKSAAKAVEDPDDIFGKSEPPDHQTAAAGGD